MKLTFVTNFAIKEWTRSLQLKLDKHTVSLFGTKDGTKQKKLEKYGHF